MIRVGFVLDLSEQVWHGGVTYFRNLFGALRDLPRPRVEPVVIARRDASEDLLRSLGAAEIIRTRWLEAGTPWFLLRRACRRYLVRDPAFEGFLHRHRIAMLSHSGNLGRRTRVPTLAWIPDLQERHLPELFDETEYAGRVQNECDQCRHATAVLVSSEAARRDLESVDLACARTAPILRFVASVPSLADLPARAELEVRYGFSGLYFHLPNQFWAHKNHRLVIEALGSLKAAGRNVLVLATGGKNDYRQPGHFERLMSFAQETGVTDRFRVLGLVPYADLMGLMAHSVAVVNPSLFEGWSTTVEEAKSMGKRLVVSDISTHREQSPARGGYFAPRDATALAEQLWQAWNAYDSVEEQLVMSAALRLLPARRREFAEAYEDIVLTLCTPTKT